MRRPRQPSSLSREVVVFVPTALLLLIVVAAFNLYLYRDTVSELRSARLEEARGLASDLAAELARGPLPTQDRLLRLVPGLHGARVLSTDGEILAESGTPGSVDLRAHIDPDRPAAVAALESRDDEAAALVGLAPFEREGRSLWVQVELPADRLALFLQTERRIVYLNIAVVASLTLLVLLYLRRLLAPYESMLERAREIGPGDQPDGDETEFLIATFERALQALDERSSEGDDIAVLEKTLAPSFESGFLLLDPDGRVLTINPVGARLLGIDPPAPGEPLDALLSPHPALFEVLDRTVVQAAALQREEVEIAPLEPSDENRVLGLSAHPLRRDDGQLRGFIVLFADLTEARRRARQAEMSRSLSQLGEIAAGVAHEMRNGLGTLKGYLTLVDHAPEDESVRDYLAEMRAESEHLERVLNDFLSFARPGTARSEALDLGAVVSRAMADPALEGRPLTFESEGDRFPVQGDAHLLEKALRNLLDNAVRAQAETDPSKPVVVRLGRADSSWVIEVEDRGPGIGREIRDSLLQPFVSGRPDGIGLGLALAHRIAELHDGELEVRDRATGGVRARLSLPVRIDT